MGCKPISELERARRKKGLTAKSLAFKMGISPVIVSEIENRNRKPYPKFIRLASQILQTPEDILFPGEFNER